MEFLMYYTVYKITNVVTGRIYVGLHQTDDLNDNYMGSGKLIKRSIAKHGKDNFIKEYLHIFDNIDDMCDAEANIVTADFVNRSDTYNMKEGGLFSPNLDNLIHGKALEERLKEKGTWEQYLKNKKDALQRYHEINESWWLGKSHTENTKRKIGKANAQIQKGDGNSQFGTRWIHNTKIEQCKKIKKDEVLPDGWSEGRIVNWESYKNKLKKKAANITKKKHHKTSQIETLKEYHTTYIKYGFDKFVELTGYDKSHPNLVQQFKRYNIVTK